MSGLVTGVAYTLRDAVRNLVRSRLRALLGLFGIAVGIASVIAMVSSGAIATAESRRQFEALGTDIVTVKVKDGRGRAGIGLDHALALAEALPSIADAAPVMPGSGTIVYASKRIGSSVKGVTEATARINRLRLAGGRFVFEMDGRSFWCVVGADVAGAMRAAGAWNVVGENLDIDGRLFTVVGELRDAPPTYGLPFELDANRSVFIPLGTAKRLRPERDVSLIIARAGPGVHHTDATRRVGAWLRERVGQSVKLEISSAKQLIEQMESQLGLLTLLLGAVGSISLLVGGIGVMNVMLISVTERRREIGIRRALGATRGDIQRQFLAEAVLLTVAGGAVGVAMGTGATWGICRITEWTFMLSGQSVLVGMVVSTVAGIFFGFQPAWRAARMDPIVALQGE